MDGEWSIRIDPLMSWSKRLRPSTLFQPRRFGDVSMETWKPVVGYEGLYEVSDLGRVKSLARKRGFCIGRERMLKFNHHPNGYILVSLSGKAKTLKAKVHRLVADAFLGSSELGVDHVDRNPKNNVLSNLRYATQRENMHNTKRLNGYPCVSVNNYGGWRVLKGYGKKSMSIGTFTTEHDAHRVEMACTTLKLAELASSMFKGIRRNTEQTNLILEKLK